MRRTLWTKYVSLVAHSGMTALTRCPTGIIRTVPETRRLYRLLLEELAALAKASGVNLGLGVVDASMTTLDAIGAQAYSSLYYDLTHGKQLELEALQGHAVALGERYGIATPMLFAVYAALRPHLDGAPAAPGV